MTKNSSLQGENPSQGPPTDAEIGLARPGAFLSEPLADLAAERRGGEPLAITEALLIGPVLVVIEQVLGADGGVTVEIAGFCHEGRERVGVTFIVARRLHHDSGGLETVGLPRQGPADTPREDSWRL